MLSAPSRARRAGSYKVVLDGRCRLCTTQFKRLMEVVPHHVAGFRRDVSVVLPMAPRAASDVHRFCATQRGAKAGPMPTSTRLGPPRTRTLRPRLASAQLPGRTCSTVER